jgi:hypothetical protein
MNRDYLPMSRPLRAAFVACAMTITTTILLFIDLLASDRGAAGMHAAAAAISIAVRG